MSSHDQRGHTGDVLALIGLELRPALAMVAGLSERLLTEELPPLDQRTCLERLRGEGVRAARFLDELVDLERLDSPESAPHLRPTDLRALLEGCAAVADRDPCHPVTLSCPGTLPAVLSEPDRIQLVLANLVANARLYSPAGGQVRLEARSWGAMVEVSVADQGLGMPSEALPRVFDRFYHVNSPGHRRIRGIGLGLAICRRIIEVHGGYIWAESPGLGQGARFVFALPAARPATMAWQWSRATSPRPTSSAPGSQPTTPARASSWSASTSNLAPGSGTSRHSTRR